MAGTRWLLFSTIALIHITPLFLPLVHAEALSRRIEHIPYLDYPGIQSAAEDAISSDLKRRGLADSSAAFAHIAARAQIDGRGHSSKTPKCKSIAKRKEWRSLSHAEKKDYMRAIKCLQTKWDYGISPVSNTLYDAFTQVHQTNWTDFHGNAYFMPWHRWFGWLHAEAMSHECGYSGSIPYWDYTKDYKNPFGSPIFSTDPEIGFGTHGTVVLSDIGLGGFKVDNGAFANMRVNLPIPHYLTRNFSAWKDADPDGVWGYELGGSFSPQQVDKALRTNTFYELEVEVDGVNRTDHLGIHNGPHFFNMGDWNGPGWLNGTKWFPAGVVAPNDPIFWNHHQNVDRIFWLWQQRPGKQWLFNGAKSFINITDDTALPSDILPFHGLGPDIPVALSLKTENWPMCYTY